MDNTNTPSGSSYIHPRIGSGNTIAKRGFVSRIAPNAKEKITFDVAPAPITLSFEIFFALLNSSSSGSTNPANRAMKIAKPPVFILIFSNVATLEKIKIKTGGFAIFIALFAGFVEPDEEEFNKAKKI